jgi:predicted  nucleic acid-binding Zn-ribbon protein
MKSLSIAFVALLGLAGSAQAQQQTITPLQAAIQIDNAVNGLASSIETLQQQNTKLSGDLAKAQGRVKELEDKYEPKAKEAEPKK